MQKKMQQSTLISQSQKSDFENLGKTMSVISSEMESVKRAGLAKNQQFIQMLMVDEAKRFGDRCPAGYQKLDLLGKGGVAVVWLA